MHNGGNEYVPHPGSRVLIVDVGKSYRLAIAMDDLAVPDLSSVGERQIYSSDTSGAKKATITLRVDGTTELLGTGDFAVRYNELKTAFDQLKSDFDNFVTITYNLHNHPTAPPGAVSPPSVTGSSSTADMSAAKIAEIKVPS